VPGLGRSGCRVGLAAGLVALASRAAFAFQGGSQFVPADQLGQDTVPGGVLVLAAYAVAWLAVVVYVWIVWRRAGRIERELSDLAAKLAASGRRRD
jgi:CcmD family protein